MKTESACPYRPHNKAQLWGRALQVQDLNLELCPPHMNGWKLLADPAQSQDSQRDKEVSMGSCMEGLCCLFNCFFEQKMTGAKYGHAQGFYCSHCCVLAEEGRQLVMHRGKKTLLFCLFPSGISCFKGQKWQGLNAGHKQQANSNK